MRGWLWSAVGARMDSSAGLNAAVGVGVLLLTATVSIAEERTYRFDSSWEKLVIDQEKATAKFVRFDDTKVIENIQFSLDGERFVVPLSSDHTFKCRRNPFGFTMEWLQKNYTFQALELRQPPIPKEIYTWEASDGRETKAQFVSSTTKRSRSPRVNGCSECNWINCRPRAARLLRR